MQMIFCFLSFFISIWLRDNLDRGGIAIEESTQLLCRYIYLCYLCSPGVLYDQYVWETPAFNVGLKLSLSLSLSLK